MRLLLDTLGRLQLPVDYLTYVERAGFRPLSITFRHAEAAGALPNLHSDPFDRMLVAQAKTDALTLVTADRQLEEYGALVLPAMWLLQSFGAGLTRQTGRT